MAPKKLCLKRDPLKASLKNISLLSMVYGCFLCLTACDGQSDTKPQNCESPIEASCFMIRGGGGWVYQTLKGCDTIPADSQLDKPGACLKDQEPVHPCDSPEPPPGAPACYVITPSVEQCPTRDCPKEYRITDYCGVRGLDAEIYEPGFDQESCRAPETLCEVIEGRTYYSKGLHAGGATPDRVNKIHWRATFNKGIVSLLYTDVIETRPYQCDGSQVLVGDQKEQQTSISFSFNPDYSEFEGSPDGGRDISYQYRVVKPEEGLCDKIQGQRFVGKTTSENPEEGPAFVEFAKDKSMTAAYNPGGDIVESGIYNCELGEVGVHLEGKNDQPVRFELSADGESLTQHGPNKEVLIREVSPDACLTIYQPVCAKVATNIECVTQPCPNHRYETFSNRCESDAAKAQFSFEGTCDKWKMEDLLSFNQEPVRLDVPKDTGVRGISVISASIKEDILTAKLGYSGCDEQSVHFNVSTAFLESNPVQAVNFFSKEREDACDAYFESTFNYDLIPLKSTFEQSYPGTELEIIIQGVTTYTQSDKK